jgi:uncharacterized membrane protein
VFAPPTGYANGFVLSNGVFSIVHFPDSQTTSPAAINNAGTIVGSYQSLDSARPRGFQCSEDGCLTVEPPGSTYSQVLGIGSGGQVVGLYGTATGSHGFLGACQ